MQQNFKSYPQVVSQFHHIAYKVKEGIITTNFIFDKKTLKISPVMFLSRYDSDNLKLL